MARTTQNYPCLEHISIVPKIFEPLKLDCSENKTYSGIHYKMNLQKLSIFKPDISVLFLSINLSYHINIVDSRYLEFQGTLWNTSRYTYLEISGLQKWRKTINWTTTFNKWICNLTRAVRTYWKYCGKEEKLLLRSNFSSFPQYFVTCS